MSDRRVVILGGSGFVGRALAPALVARGERVRVASRHPVGVAGVETVACDLLRPETIPPALQDMDAAYYLVHSMGTGQQDFRDRDLRAAQAFAQAAAHAGMARIVYLGGVAPREPASEHLSSRLEVGEVLRNGSVPTLELRASMVIGAGSASWQISRDLATRLPFMILPRWLQSRTRPIALDDVVQALVDALDVPLEGSAWFDIPGPDTLSGKEILERIVTLKGRRLRSLSVPLLTPALSALWLHLVTSADFDLSRNLVLGLTHDLLPKDERYWALTGHPARIGFDEAALAALRGHADASLTWRSTFGRLEESLVQRFTGPRQA